MNNLTQNLMRGSWGMLLFRGILALLFGFIAMMNTKGTTLVLLYWFVVFAIADGIFIILMSFVHRNEKTKLGLSLSAGIFSIIFGLLALLWPEMTAALLLFYIAARALLGGLFEIMLAIKTRGWWMLLGGFISAAFGLLMFFQPVIMGLTLVWFVGAWAIALGIFLIVEAFRRKGSGNRPAIA
jgi:uncharacterized membrane protein HdeD (DUF308 family)